MSMMILVVGAALVGGYIIMQQGGFSLGGGGDSEPGPSVPESQAQTQVPATIPASGQIPMQIQDQGIILVLTQSFGRPPTPREICRAQCKRVDRMHGKNWKCRSNLDGGICFCNCRRRGGFGWGHHDRDDWWRRDWPRRPGWGHGPPGGCRRGYWDNGKWRCLPAKKNISVVEKKPSRWDKLPPKDWNKVETKPGSTVTTPDAPAPEGNKKSALVLEDIGFTGIV